MLRLILSCVQRSLYHESYYLYFKEIIILFNMIGYMNSHNNRTNKVLEKCSINSGKLHS